MKKRVCLAEIVGAHGIAGLVKLKCFTERPEDVGAYGPLSDESGRREFRVRVSGPAKAGALARIEGVGDRNAAEALRGTRLYLDRDRLPEAVLGEDEFFQADLIGLVVERMDGTQLGRVAAVVNFGAGDLLEIARPGAESFYLPFSRAMVPVVDLASGRLRADPPADWPGEAGAAAEREG